MKIGAAFLSHDHLLKVQLSPGLLGKVIETDSEGDALVNFPSLASQLKDTMCWVRATDFKFLYKRDDVQSESI